MKDIEDRLRDMANKWHDANREVFEVCRDAAEEIRVLRVQRNCALETKEATIIAYSHGTGWGNGKDE